MTILDSHEKFDGVGPHAETIETRARIGERFLDCYDSALNDPLLKGWCPADCPSEIVIDLLERLNEAAAALIAKDEEIARLKQGTPTYDKCDTYVAGQYVFNYLRTFLAAAGIDASRCKLVIELPDRDTQRQLVSILQREAKGSPRSAARAGNHSGVWQGVEYEFALRHNTARAALTKGDEG